MVLQGQRLKVQNNFFLLCQSPVEIQSIKSMKIQYWIKYQIFAIGHLSYPINWFLLSKRSQISLYNWWRLAFKDFTYWPFWPLRWKISMNYPTGILFFWSSNGQWVAPKLFFITTMTFLHLFRATSFVRC